MERSARWLVAGVALVVVVSVVAAVLASTRDTAQFATDSPEGVVQTFLEAVADDDADTALDLLDQELQLRCDPEFGDFPRDRDDSFRAELLEVETEGDGATVDIRITEFTGAPPFGGPGYDHEERYELTRTDSGWRISEFSWPYSPCPRFP